MSLTNPLQITTTILLFTLAVLAAVFGRTAYALLCLPGMFLLTHSDICRTQISLVYRLYREPATVGSISRGSGYIFIIAAMLASLDGKGSIKYMVASFVAYLIIALAVTLFTTRKMPDTAYFKAIIFVYSLLLAVLAAAAFTFGLARGGILIQAALGGLLLVIYDGMYSLKEYGGNKLPVDDLVIWGIYIVAMIFILLPGFFV